MPNQTWRGAELDPNGCLSLSTILRSFSAPITEEQAWAIAYQALKCLQNCLNSCHQLLLTSDPAHLLMHSEGFVHHLTFQQPKLQNGAAISRQARQRGNLKSENKAIADLAIVVYAALDYGLNPNEQRSLSMDMEDILEKMTSADERQSDDEGIEQDQAEDDDEDDNNGHDQIQHRRPRIKISGMCAIMLEKCGNHLSATSEAEDHFRNVCRALVSESLELSTFMLKVSEFDEDRASELKELDMQDWARLWVQCIRDLRHGVKLKKTNYSKTPVEFEMTPYEILMDDIRSRRYKLNKIMVDGEIPQMVKKDAHNIILEFIRSRPPLRPASKRAIQPTRRESTPVELLMESIRNSKARSSLRKTAGPKPRRKFMSVHESSRTFIQDDDVANGPKTRFNTLGSQDKPDGHHTTRKMIRVDQNDMDELLNFSGDETDIESMGGLSRQVSRDSSVSNRDLRMMNGDKHSKDKPDVPQRNDISRVAKDLAMYGKSEEMDQRRHSVSVCETPVKMRTTNPRRQKLFIKADSRSSTSISSSNATTPSSSGRATPIFGAHTNESLAAPSGEETFLSPSYGLNTAQMHANLQSEFLQSEHWAAALETLDLNLDELVHIRSVLTKAELESLPLDGTFKEDVEKGKICFLCMKTRFGIFVWGVRCQLCKQQVCSKCSSKMRIPLEHFSSIPSFALSPKVMSSLGPENQVSSTSPNPTCLSSEAKPQKKPIRTKSFVQTIRNRVSSNLPSLRNSAGSAPTSPEMGRKSSSGPPAHFRDQIHAYGSLNYLNVPEEDEYEGSGSASLPANVLEGTKRVGSKKSKEESLQGAMLQVCSDCREMVLQVIRAQRTAKRFQMTKMMFANAPKSTMYAKDEIF
ncbi:protein spire-like isoform X2 [Tigriopus californicus]|uniref:protein spire-like isoform X2 n=1 Tax=Tigriopus californicus TaxID=6832 RepID=UPI0027D9EE93|nr:protein spire-like isoform X2 [Tigriopus californicus]